jgi:hypothetical protein
MNTKHKGWTIAAIVIPVLIGAYLIYRYLKKTKSTDYDTSPAPTKIFTTAASDFPLQKGSRNELVKKLQAYLGVTADGIFGPKTEAALLAATGKTTVASAAELDTLLAKAAAKSKTDADVARAEKLVNDWKKGGNLMAIAAGKAIQIIEDQYGALQPTGKEIELPVNQPMPRSVVIPLSSTINGFLKFKVVAPLNISTIPVGLYKVDPNKITLA